MQAALKSVEGVKRVKVKKDVATVKAAEAVKRSDLVAALKKAGFGVAGEEST